MKQKRNFHLGSILIAVAIIISAVVLANAYTYKYKSQETITVTGLGETSFVSDLIVWSGHIAVDTQNVELGYKELEANKAIVEEFIRSKGIDEESTTFDFVSVNKEYESSYGANGNYSGQRFTGYTLTQPIVIESSNVEVVESMSREISSLIARGITIESYSPAYYYTKLEDVKLTLIETASADALQRATKIATASGAKLGKVQEAKMGVFQITGANTTEAYSAGGSLNTSSRNKKARITMKIEYKIK
ncbi:MAG: SIMPL domain-containing protein [Rikenellaceae bacterium]